MFTLPPPTPSHPIPPSSPPRPVYVGFLGNWTWLLCLSSSPPVTQLPSDLDVREGVGNSSGEAITLSISHAVLLPKSEAQSLFVVARGVEEPEQGVVTQC